MGQGNMGRVSALVVLSLLFCFAGWEGAGELEAVLVQPNRSIILGEVQEVERDFPQVKLTVRVIKSYVVEGYVNLIREDEIIEICPSYTGKEFKIPSFFENERNLNNLQAYYFLAGDYFFAEVSLFGDEKARKVFYLDIQRVNEESVLKTEKRPRQFLSSYDEGEWRMW